MTYATEKQSRRHFVGLLGVGAGMAGFLAGASALGAANGGHNILSATHLDTLIDSVLSGDLIHGNGTPKWARLPKGSADDVLTMVGGLPTWKVPSGGPHNLLSTNHPDTLPGSVVKGDLTIGNATPKWARLPVGFNGQILQVSGGTPQWVLNNSLQWDSSSNANTAIVAIADNVAPITVSGTYTAYIGLWLIEVASAANAQISITFDVHKANHVALDLNYRAQFDPTGAGDIHIQTGTYFAFCPSIPGVNLHLNVSALTLGGGTVTVVHRLGLGLF